MPKCKVALFFLAAWLGLTLNAFSEEFAAFAGKLTHDGINVRVDSTTGAQVACALSKGQLVEVVGEAYGWFKVRLPKEAPSYINKTLVECIDRSAGLPGPAKCLNAKVTARAVNIRLGPSESSWIVGKAGKSTVVNILGEKGSWYKIEPVHDSFGWIYKKFVIKAPELPKAEEGVPAPAEAEPKPEGQLIIEGTVRPYGIAPWRKTTHKLVTGDNKAYLLKGNRSGLNSLNYHKVKITGKLTGPANAEYPVVQVDMIEELN